ncbi:MAG TPA: zinc ribbon domain-containing protein [Candidatus Limnocylindrales bacterium]|nr:zinc ribbon domain-containing protein [Candidatus Limnocylindrales bacterium]
MTVNVARRRAAQIATARAAQIATSSADAPTAIGEFEPTTFACPACRRPLALAARRCPGCGTRFLMRVELRRASVFIGVGLLVGLMVGGGLTAVSSAIDRPARDARIAAEAAVAAVAAAGTAADPVASVRPVATQGTGGSSGVGGTAGVPALTRSAIGQALAVDTRLASSATALAGAAGARTFDTVEVAAILRTLSGDAVFGLQLTSHIGAWKGGTEVSGTLGAFYTAVRDVAAEGLTASIRNEAAYRAASTRMLQLLADLEGLDGSLRTVAAEAGVSLP